MLHSILLTAFLSAYAGDITTTCINIRNGEHELNQMIMFPNSCLGPLAQSGVGIASVLYLMEKKHSPTWVRVAVYGGLAGAHGWAFHHNLR